MRELWDSLTNNTKRNLLYAFVWFLAGTTFLLFVSAAIVQLWWYAIFAILNLSITIFTALQASDYRG